MCIAIYIYKTEMSVCPSHLQGGGRGDQEGGQEGGGDFYMFGEGVAGEMGRVDRKERDKWEGGFLWWNAWVEILFPEQCQVTQLVDNPSSLQYYISSFKWVQKKSMRGPSTLYGGSHAVTSYKDKFLSALKNALQLRLKVSIHREDCNCVCSGQQEVC